MRNLSVRNIVLSALTNGQRLVRILTVLAGIFMLAEKSAAQFVAEPFVSDDELILESWYFNTIDESKRLSIFSLNEAKHEFNAESTSLLSYGLVGFDWVKGFGPVGGWRFTQSTAAALAGLQYAFYRKEFLLYSTLNSELKEDPSFEFYSLIQFRPQLSDKFKAFSQLQVSTNHLVDAHTYTLLRLRVGADLGKIQTGIGLEQTFVGEDWDHSVTPGLFLRLELY